MIFNAPISFEEALKLNAVKTALGTSLTSAQMRAVLDRLPEAIRRRALFSATMENAKVINRLGELVDEMVKGELGGAKARESLKEFMVDSGITTAPGTDGTIKDFLGADRLNLMLQTNEDVASGYGQFVQRQDADALDSFPALELFRLEDRKDPRDWEARWMEAVSASGDGKAGAALQEGGIMAALNDSPIWDMLGSLWDDSLGNPFAPFAFNSGMWTRPVSREQAIELGLMEESDTVKPREIPDFNATFKMSKPDMREDLFAALTKHLGDGVKLDGDVIRLEGE